MPLVSKIYQLKSRWIKASDLEDGDSLVTISEVREELLGQPGNQDRKLCVYFREDPTRALALNKINANTIASMLGDNTDDWRGHKITLYASETSYAGEQVACVRIRTNPRRTSRPTPSTAADVRYPSSLSSRIQNLPRVENAPHDNAEEEDSESLAF